MTEAPSPAPSSGISHVDALPPGTRLAEFEVLGLLGVGGFGMVYKAFDHTLHRAVAIKEYMPSAMAGRSHGQTLWVRSESDQHTFQAGLASFVDEARLLAQFDHPSLVKVFRFWEANNTAYMVMPLYIGMTFKQARAQMRTPPSEAWLRKLLWAVLGALRVLHEGKTLHRDISPDNIFLQDAGPPVLLDLGAARHAISDQDRKHTAVLKVNYAPIEQYSDGDEELRQGPWSDLYSLAAVVHGCLCNDTPLPATLRSIRDRMVSFSRVARTVHRQFGVDYSAPFVAAIAKSLSLRPADRPQSIDEFLEIMEMTTAPEGSETFDFRADLGDVWVEPADRPGPAWTTRTVDVTSPQARAQARAAETTASVASATGRPPHGAARGGDTLVYAAPAAAEGGDTVFIDAGDTVAAEDSRYDEPESPARSVPNPKRAPAAQASAEGGTHGSAPGAPAPLPKARMRPPLTVWLALAVAAVVLAAAGLRWMQSGAAAHEDIITETAEPRPLPAHPAPPSPAVQEPAVTGGTHEAVSAAVQPVSAVLEAPVPAFVPAASAVRTPPRTAKRPAADPAAPADAVAHEAPRPAPAPPPPPVAPERPRPAAPRVVSPQEACADSNFLARPLCIHQECQKAASMTHPICVENRRKQEAEEQRRGLTPN